jgi:hypothetical protein
MGLLTGFWAGAAGATAAGAGAVTTTGGLEGLVFVTSVSPPSANASGAWHAPIKMPMAHCQSNLWLLKNLGSLRSCTIWPPLARLAFNLCGHEFARKRQIRGGGPWRRNFLSYEDHAESPQ